MRKVKVAYAKVNNAGDLFNEALLDYFGVNYTRTSVIGADLVMLGGLLSALVPTNNAKASIKQGILKTIYDTNRPLHVWGSGYLIESVSGKYMRENLLVHALRGEMSKEKLSKDINESLDVVLADPGLLASEFLTGKTEKKYSVGIIPHFREKTVDSIMSLPEKYNNSLLIDICKPYDEVIKEISSCECIISSSLHGLIFADSLNVPNMHVVASNNLKGTGFKFKDYYSSYGLEHVPFSLSMDKFPSVQTVHDLYAINYSDVEDKKESLLRTFPKNICE